MRAFGMMEIDQPSNEDDYSLQRVVSQRLSRVPEADMVDATTPTEAVASSPPSRDPFRSNSPPFSLSQLLESPRYADRPSQASGVTCISKRFRDDNTISTMLEHDLQLHESISVVDDNVNDIALQAQGPEADSTTDEDEEISSAKPFIRSCDEESSQSVEPPVIQSPHHEGSSIDSTETPPFLRFEVEDFHSPSLPDEDSSQLQSSQASPFYDLENNVYAPTLETVSLFQAHPSNKDSSVLRYAQTSIVKQIETSDNGEDGGRVKQSIVNWSGGIATEIQPGTTRTRIPRLAARFLRSRRMELSSPEAASKDQLMTFVLEKKLTCRDLRGNQNRIILPKRLAEKHLPSVKKDEEISLEMEDFTGPCKWNFRLRCCSAKKSQKYELENTREYIDQYNLGEGDKIVIYKDQPSGQYVIRSMKKGSETEHIEMGSSSDEKVPDLANEPDMKIQSPKKEEDKKPNDACKNDTEASAGDELQKGKIALADEMIMDTRNETVMKICHEEVENVALGSSSHENVPDLTKEPNVKSQSAAKEEDKKPTDACKNDIESCAGDETEKSKIAAAEETKMSTTERKVDISVYEGLEDIVKLAL